jgi:thiosulfate reductase cytochrome b subunit
MFSAGTVAEYWAFTIVLLFITVSGLFLLRDWLFTSFGVFGGVYVSTPKYTMEIHIYFGIIFCIMGIVHLAYHLVAGHRDILPMNTRRDFKAFLHSGMHMIGFSRRPDIGTGAKYDGRQRITYMALIYILGLAAITGMLFYFEVISESLAMVHILPAGLGFMVLLFVFLFTIRRHDSIALKSKFGSGSVPVWYARKNHPIWFKKFLKTNEGLALMEEMGIPTKKKHGKAKPFGDDAFSKAVSKFVLLTDNNPDKKAVQAITSELRDSLNKKDEARVIQLAKEL